MNERVILPPTYLSSYDPLIFLAGPIQGAPNWQKEAVNIIHNISPDILVASPRRGRDELGAEFVYEEQVDWETYHLRKAGEKGVVLFWLAKEKDHVCERAYAQTSRFELAEWKVRHEREQANLAVGIDEGFSNARYIKRRFAQDCPEIEIFSSLEETCTQAAKNILEYNYTGEFTYG